MSQPLIFATEIVTFFKTMGLAKMIDKGKPKGRAFYAFERSSYGIVNLRLNKNLLLVFTHNGKRDLKEGYAFTVSDTGEVTFDSVRQV